MPYIYPFEYKPTTRSWKRGKPLSIHIMEPNISNTKTSIIPLLAGNECLLRTPDMIHGIYIHCGHTNATSIQSLLSLDTHPYASKIHILKRHGFFELFQTLSPKNNVIVSHQQWNELNYIYWDSITVGIPVIHNSDVLADFQYHYKGNDISHIKRLIEQLYHTSDTEIQTHIQRDLVTSRARYGKEAP